MTLFDRLPEGIRLHGGYTLATWRTEARALITLAWPLVATQLAQMAVLTTDVLMLGRFSKEALAASAVGLTLFNFVFMFGLGMAAATAPMIAHILGRNPQHVAPVRAVVRMALWCVVIFAVPSSLIFIFARDLLIIFGQDPQLSEAAGHFILPLSVGLPCALAYQVLRNYVTALRRPRAALIVMILTIIFNIIGDYLLIFGHCGMPRLGLIGSGIASAASYTFSFIAMIAVVQISPELRRYRIWRRFFRPDWRMFRENLRLGVPTGLTSLFEGALFMGSTLVMGTIGTVAVAAHQIALNFSSITFMVPLGIGMAASVRVGLAAGAGSMAGARHAGFTALTLSLFFMGLCALTLALFSHQIIGIYIATDDPANADTVKLASSLLLVAAAFQLLDGTQVTSAFNLRGLKDAQKPMWIAGACYWLIGFPACILFAKTLNLGGVGVWFGLALSLSCAAIMMTARFYRLSRPTYATPSPQS